MFKVTTTDGITANKGSDKHATGLAEDVARADCKDRNERAESMGLTVRYEVREMEPEVATA